MYVADSVLGIPEVEVAPVVSMPQVEYAAVVKVGVDYFDHGDGREFDVLEQRFLDGLLILFVTDARHEALLVLVLMLEDVQIAHQLLTEKPGDERRVTVNLAHFEHGRIILDLVKIGNERS